VHNVEHSIEMFVCCGFKNLDSFRIRLAHAADMMAEVAFGDELRQDGLIERRRMRSTKLRLMRTPLPDARARP
jgi:hypothetical protein